MRFHEIFGAGKPVIGMLHLKGDARRSAVDRAMDEARIYRRWGVDAVLVENYFGSEQDCRQVLKLLGHEGGFLYGVNILGDFRHGFALAREYGASFVQLDSVCGHLPAAQDAWFARELDGLRASFDGAVLGGVRFKYQPVRSGRTEEEDLRLGMARCDAIVVTGAGTGVKTPQEKLSRFRRTVGSFPLLVGAGCTLETVGETFAQADGVIVGSYFKEGHCAQGDLSAAHVARFMAKKSLCCAVGARLPAHELEQLDTFVHEPGNGPAEAYLRHYRELAHGYRKAVGYGFATALAGMGGYMSAIHPLGHFDSRMGIDLPFSFMGWMRPSLPGEAFGDMAIAYRLDRDCFCGRDPLLFYTDDSLGEGSDWVRLVEGASSGISHVRLVRLPQERNFGKFSSRWVLTFRLSRDACKEALLFGERELSTREVGRYVACFPRCGEFDVALGQVVGEDLSRLDVLAVDSFFMK